MRAAAWGLFIGTAAAWRLRPAALDTISPCPAASNPPEPIVVTTQYQPVSTCTAAATTCKKHRCRTSYEYSTYDYVSTVIPCAYEGSTSTKSTITKTDQTVVVSRTTFTSTELTVTPTSFTQRGRPTTTSKTVTAYTTVVKEWSAVYKDLGPQAIEGYPGSGLCSERCRGPAGSEYQILEGIECRNSDKQPTVCRRWPETWIYQVLPTSTTPARALCTSHATLPTAGTYTFTFPQRVPATTVRVPERVITYTRWGTRPTVITTTITETVTVFPPRQWTAFVTRRCARPTVIDFEVTVTTTIYYTIPPFTPPYPKPTTIPVPHSWGDWTITKTTTPAPITTTGLPPTGLPTTGQPTTGLPTTGLPTTGLPTTGLPTTGLPTTGLPTTGLPTTGLPTTGLPTTGLPTTGLSTTGLPTTGLPTTGLPTTGPPTTGSPTTGLPTTGLPTTGLSTTGLPTTGLPTTGLPTTGLPTSGASTSIATTSVSPVLPTTSTGGPIVTSTLTTPVLPTTGETTISTLTETTVTLGPSTTTTDVTGTATTSLSPITEGTTTLTSSSTSSSLSSIVPTTTATVSEGTTIGTTTAVSEGTTIGTTTAVSEGTTIGTTTAVSEGTTIGTTSTVSEETTTEATTTGSGETSSPATIETTTAVTDETTTLTTTVATTATASTTSTPDPAPFNIEIVNAPPARYRRERRQASGRYLSFDGVDISTVSTLGDAAIFWWYGEGRILSDAKFLGADAANVVIRADNLPSRYSRWEITGDIILPEGAIGLCALGPAGPVSVLEPGDTCQDPIILVRRPIAPPLTSTSETAAGSTTTEPSTAEPSTAESTTSQIESTSTSQDTTTVVTKTTTPQTGSTTPETTTIQPTSTETTTTEETTTEETISTTTAAETTTSEQGSTTPGETTTAPGEFTTTPGETSTTTLASTSSQEMPSTDGTTTSTEATSTQESITTTTEEVSSTSEESTTITTAGEEGTTTSSDEVASTTSQESIITSEERTTTSEESSSTSTSEESTTASEESTSTSTSEDSTTTSEENSTTSSTSEESSSTFTTEEPTTSTTSEEITSTTTTAEETTSTATTAEESTSTTSTSEEITSTTSTSEEITSTTSTSEEITSTTSTSEEITSTTSTTEEITSTTSTTEEITSTTTEETPTTTTLPPEPPEPCAFEQLYSGEDVWNRFYDGSGVHFSQPMSLELNIDPDWPSCEVLTMCANIMSADIRSDTGTIVIQFSTADNKWSCFGSTVFYNNPNDFTGSSPQIQQIYGFNMRRSTYCGETSFIVGAPPVEWGRYFAGIGMAPTFPLTLGQTFINAPTDCEAIQSCLANLNGLSGSPGGTVFLGFSADQNAWFCSGTSEYYTDPAQFSATTEYGQVYALAANPADNVCAVTQYTSGPPTTLVWNRFYVGYGVMLQLVWTLSPDVYPGDTEACAAMQLCVNYVNSHTGGGGTAFLAFLPLNLQWHCFGSSEFSEGQTGYDTHPAFGVVYAASVPIPAPACAETVIQSSSPSLQWERFFFGRMVEYSGPMDLPIQILQATLDCEAVQECIAFVNTQSGGGGVAITYWDLTDRVWRCAGSTSYNPEPGRFSYNQIFGDVYGFAVEPPPPNPRSCPREQFEAGSPPAQWQRFLAAYALRPTFPLNLPRLIYASGVQACVAIQQCVDAVAQQTGGGGTAVVGYALGSGTWECSGASAYYTDPDLFEPSGLYAEVYAVSFPIGPGPRPICQDTSVSAGNPAVEWQRYLLSDAVEPAFAMPLGRTYYQDSGALSPCFLIRECVQSIAQRTAGGGTAFFGFDVSMNQWFCAGTGVYLSDPDQVFASTTYAEIYLFSAPPPTEPGCSETAFSGRGPNRNWERFFFGTGVEPDVPMDFVTLVIVANNDPCAASQACVEYMNTRVLGANTAIVLMDRANGRWTCMGSTTAYSDSSAFGPSNTYGEVYGMMALDPPPQPSCSTVSRRSPAPRERLWSRFYFSKGTSGVYTYNFMDYNVGAEACEAIERCLDYTSEQTPHMGLTAVIQFKIAAGTYVCNGLYQLQNSLVNFTPDNAVGEIYAFSTGD